MFISCLATLNFSLAFWVGLLASPLTFVRPSSSPALGWTIALLLNLVSPPAVLVAGCGAWGLGVTDVLRDAAFGWDVWGMYTPLVVWCVWWPAWLAGSVVALGRPAGKEKTA
jgi:glycosylphosphatidylinositol transamidase